MASMNLHKDPLKVTVIDGLLSITIGIHTLATVATNSEAPDSEIKISDQEVFAQSVLVRLQDEQEDGTTPVHIMLDSVVAAMAEDGDDGLDLDQDDDEDDEDDE